VAPPIALWHIAFMDAESAELLARLRRDAECIGQRFQLRYRAIAAEHPRVKSRYGACYQDGLIKIRLRHARTGKPLKYSSLIDTLCHELAHLRHFNHGPEFKALFLRLLAWARHEGIYRPGPTEREHPWERAARAQLAAPPRRNGVLVFPEPAATDDAGPLPWERALAAAQAASPSSTVPPPSPALPLSAPARATTTSGAAPARAATTSAASPVVRRAPSTQLSLFS
jgi:hypothetical protein